MGDVRIVNGRSKFTSSALAGLRMRAAAQREQRLVTPVMSSQATRLTPAVVTAAWRVYSVNILSIFQFHTYISKHIMLSEFLD
ncbi:MAG: hypothetical protein ACYDG2_14440 [Ruminiclostridium sp.]